MQTVTRKQEMQIFNLKWPLSLTNCSIFFFFSKSKGFKLLMVLDKLCKFNENLTTPVEAIDEKDKLCKFHENPTKNVVSSFKFHLITFQKVIDPCGIQLHSWQK